MAVVKLINGFLLTTDSGRVSVPELVNLSTLLDAIDQSIPFDRIF